MPKDLSETLKEATKEVHTQAENVEFMRNFQKGQVTREGFKVCDCWLARTFGGGGVGGTPRYLRPIIEWRGWSQDDESLSKEVILLILTLAQRREERVTQQVLGLLCDADRGAWTAGWLVEPLLYVGRCTLLSQP